MGDTDDPSPSQDDPERRRQGVRIELIDPGSLVAPPIGRWLIEHAARLTAHLGPAAEAGELRIELVDDDAMRRAHDRWLGDPTTTDVLTFDLRETEHAQLDTDLMVCVDEARRQAEARGLPIEHELLLYITHGLLHCLGHDDHDEADARAMHEREDELLTAIGLGAVFAARGGDA